MAVDLNQWLEALRDMVHELFPKAVVDTDYQLGVVVGEVWRYYGDRAFELEVHKRLLLVGVDSEVAADFGKGYRDGYFLNADLDTRQRYYSCKGKAFRRLLAEQCFVPRCQGRVSDYRG